MKYRRMAIEVESPEQLGYESIRCNLAESSVTDAVFRDLKFNVDDLVLCYGHHIGKPEFRTLLASRYAGIHDKDVLLTAGAAAALFIVSTSLLEKDDHLVVAHPNYSTNIETPRMIGCKTSFLPLSFEEGFAVKIDELSRLVTPQTRLISLTTPHNPTGTMLQKETLEQLVQLVEKFDNCYLLLDETYRELTFSSPPPLAATLSPKIISVSSLSKAQGLPGIRLGWLINKDPRLQELFLAAKEQIYITNSVLDEEVGYQFMLKEHLFNLEIKKHIRTNFEILRHWIYQHPHMEWVEPKGGVVCFPRIKEKFKIDTSLFYRRLYQQHKTLVGPGHWFEMPDHYMRIGFGWPSKERLLEGLQHIDSLLKELIG